MSVNDTHNYAESMQSVCKAPRTPSHHRIYRNLVFSPTSQNIIITIYAPMIYTAPCIMFWMRAYTLRGEVGGALELPSFWTL
jgi:hypothetical protein